MEKKSPRNLVLKHYPNAIAVNVGTKKGGNYYHIMSGDEYLGKGKSKLNAWTASLRNIND